MKPCLDCKIDISSLHFRCKRCPECAEASNRRRSAARSLRLGKYYRAKYKEARKNAELEKKRSADMFRHFDAAMASVHASRGR